MRTAGAPMSLTSYDALHAPAPTDSSIQVWEMLGRRINDTRMPMPPVTMPRLTAADKAVLDGWVAASAPMRATGASCGGDDGGVGVDGGVGPVGPDALPCTPTHTFTAHAAGSATEAYYVPEGAGNLYQCFTFRSPFVASAQATAWAPIIDDERVIHHWILYRTATSQPDGGVSGCSMPSDAEFVMGWAPGGPNAIMPPDVGMELGDPGDSFILQVHYWNTAGYTDAFDRSGVAICATDTPREHEAGILWLGTPAISIPPRSTDVTVTGTCPSYITSLLPEPLHLLASGPHMHQLGTHFITELRRGGSASASETLVEVAPWDFNNQTTYWHPDVVLQPGDSLVTRCTYDNPGDNTVSFGERTEDEMCFNFVTAYPTSAFVGGERRCIGL
jgi:hypothetical protein